MEVILLSNQASSAGSGNGATNRNLGGLRAWLSTNDSLGGGGSSGGGQQGGGSSGGGDNWKGGSSGFGGGDFDNDLDDDVPF